MPPSLTGRRWMIALGALVGAAVLDRRVLRPWYERWGAGDAERTLPLPGDELLPDAQHIVTRAIAINAPAADI